MRRNLRVRTAARQVIPCADNALQRLMVEMARNIRPPCHKLADVDESGELSLNRPVIIWNSGKPPFFANSNLRPAAGAGQGEDVSVLPAKRTRPSVCHAATADSAADRRGHAAVRVARPARLVAGYPGLGHGGPVPARPGCPPVDVRAATEVSLRAGARPPATSAPARSPAEWSWASSTASAAPTFKPVSGTSARPAARCTIVGQTCHRRVFATAGQGSCTQLCLLCG